ncbi:MAG TPA: hypothetical protein VK793_13865 [Steroidobacteraceae bacterium]|jgi:hypothetical protein|nr:hypothetical protein [Steroidobacteraceae bacterium]
MYTKFTVTFATRHAGPSWPMLLPILGTLLMAAAWAPRAHAGDVYIACSAGVTLSMTDIRDVFLGEKQFAGPVKLLPVDNGAAQTDFLEKVMKMDAIKYTTAWTKKSFRDGSTPPSVKSGDGEVVEFLKHTPGGCGYLGAPPPAGLTLIGKI